MKIESLKEACVNKSISFEFEDHSDRKLFGLTFGKGVWHWFVDYSGDLFFHHSYSQNTGRTKKGITHKFKVYDSVSKKLNLTF